MKPISFCAAARVKKLQFNARSTTGGDRILVDFTTHVRARVPRLVSEMDYRTRKFSTHVCALHNPSYADEIRTQPRDFHDEATDASRARV